MKDLKLFSVLSAFIILAAIGCSKGNTGPAGARGPAGPDSVLHSSWIALSTPFSATDSSYEQSVTASALTARFLDSGVVLSYIGLLTNSGDTAVLTLADASSLVAPISQALFPGKIDIYAAVDYSGNFYRYVLIPGSMVVGNNIAGKKYTAKELQTMSYKEVIKAFPVTTTGRSN